MDGDGRADCLGMAAFFFSGTRGMTDDFSEELEARNGYPDSLFMRNESISIAITALKRAFVRSSRA